MNEYTINEYLKLVVKERDRAIKDNKLYDLALKAIKDTEKFCNMENELLFLDCNRHISRINKRRI